MFERVLNTPLQLKQFHALQLKTREHTYAIDYHYQPVQRFFSENAVT